MKKNQPEMLGFLCYFLNNSFDINLESNTVDRQGSCQWLNKGSMPAYSYKFMCGLHEWQLDVN